MHPIRGFAGLALAVLVSACASISPQERAFYDQQTTRLREQGVGLVGDGCVYRDDVGDDDYVLLKASRDFGEAVTRRSYAYLGSHGMVPRTKETPFVCGGGPLGIHRLPNQDMLAAQSSGAQRKALHMPLPLIDAVSRDPALAAAYHAMIAKAENAVVRGDAASNTPVAVPLGLTDDQRARLKAAIKAPNVWIVRGAGAQVSMGKSIGTGLITAALTLGTVAVIVMDGYRFDVALVDLDKNQVVWTKHVPVQAGDPASGMIQNGDWVRGAFAPFISESTP